MTINAPLASQYDSSGYLPIKRFCDVVVALGVLAVFWPVLAIVAVLVRMTSPGPALYWSRRSGRLGVPFNMPKFRSMRIDTPKLATRDLQDPERWLTPMGKFLRRTSLDELPQVWSVLTGKMSFIGPRAIMVEEVDLLNARHNCGVDVLRPGISGWAQVNGRDLLGIEEKVALDAQYLQHCSVSFDIMIALKTIKRVLGSTHVTH